MPSVQILDSFKKRITFTALLLVTFFYVLTPMAAATTAEPVIEQKVSQHGTWVNQTHLQPGETASFLLAYHNHATTPQRVVLKDSLPAKTSLAPGSTYLYAPVSPKGAKQTDTLTTVGVGSGVLKPNETAFVMFSAVVPTAANLLCGDNLLLSHGSATVMGTAKVYTSNAQIVVHKDCTPPQPAQYRCYGLAARVISGRQVMIYDFKYASPHPTDLDYVVVDWGDATPARRAVTQADQYHTYAKDGTYGITAHAYFKVSGAPDVVRNCTMSIQVLAPVSTALHGPTTPASPVAATAAHHTQPTTRSTPATMPDTLVNTGAGNVWGIAAAVAVAATGLRYALLRRSSH